MQIYFFLSYKVRTVMTVERSRDVDFNAHIVLKVDMIQVVASKERWPGDLLSERQQVVRV